MKRPDTKLKLVGPSGDKELWIIRFGTPPIKSDYGSIDWVKRVVVINNRLRNPKVIRSTLLHEIAHVTAGHNASEEFVINLEENYLRAAKATGVE